MTASEAFRWCLFQSTPPARGATFHPIPYDEEWVISIHAPREGGDFTIPKYSSIDTPFQSTPPARGATQIIILITRRIRISIHAPREGGDNLIIQCRSWPTYFNPRPPRGGRPSVTVVSRYSAEFQSTPPARGATVFHALIIHGALISIHAPREGGDHRRAL